MKTLSAILQAFRTDIPNSSLTAQAIDRGALLEEISQVAACTSPASPRQRAAKATFNGT